METKYTVISLTLHNLLNSLLEGQDKEEVEKAGNRQKSRTLASEAPADSSCSPGVLCGAHALHFVQRESSQGAGSRRATLLLCLHKPISNLTCLFQHLDPTEVSAIAMRPDGAGGGTGKERRERKEETQPGRERDREQRVSAQGPGVNCQGRPAGRRGGRETGSLPHCPPPPHSPLGGLTVGLAASPQRSSSSRGT